MKKCAKTKKFCCKDCESAKHVAIQKIKYVNNLNTNLLF